MSRRSTPERLENGKRAATLEWLVSAGMLRERASAALKEWQAAHDGRGRDWEAAYRAISRTLNAPDVAVGLASRT